MKSEHTSLEEANICLNLWTPASAFYTLVPKHGIMVTRYQNFDHCPYVDHELTDNKEPKEVSFPLVSPRESEQIQTEGDSRNGGTHDARGLSDVFPLHGSHALLGVETLLMPSKAVVDSLRDEGSVQK